MEKSRYYVLHIPSGQYLKDCIGGDIQYTLVGAENQLRDILRNNDGGNKWAWNIHNKDIGYNFTLLEFEVIEIENV